MVDGRSVVCLVALQRWQSGTNV